jgi:TPR repeat protein
MEPEVRQQMERASRGDPAAMRELAEALYRGRGCERCVAQAGAWLLLAAELGDEPARHLLARLRERGVASWMGF